jgi:lipopolysaccharide/colanic/teichoic acid biosynthesis glycosyltransferase
MRDVVKRAFDVIVASVLLLVLSPLLLIVALLVRVALGTPVLFRQRRPGRDGKPFTLLKFRTMRSPSSRRELADEHRLSRLGRLLRRTSVDELPELMNVVLGQMSLVGPRPLLMEYLTRYTPEQMRRHDVRPGVTGWAQVKGRNLLSWEEKFRLDVWYVDHRSLALDLRILASTIGAVLKGRGVSAPGAATMPPFEGAVGARAVGSDAAR